MLTVWAKDWEKSPLGILQNIRWQRVNLSVYIKLSKE